MNLTKLITVILLLVPLFLISSNIVVEDEIHWKENTRTKIDELYTKEFLSFENAKYDAKKDFLGIYSKQIVLNKEKIVGINIIDVKYEDIEDEKVKNVSGHEFINDNINIRYVNAVSRKINYGEIILTPIIFNSKKGGYQRVTQYKVEVITKKENPNNNSNNKSFATNSVLESGDWYKIAVLDDGVFKLSYDFLKNLGLDIDNLNPNNFKLYGNGGKMLPALNSDFRIDDIRQNAVYVEGELDGSFDKEDYVLFYGQSPHLWEYNTGTLLFEHQMNKYSDSTYYYITFSNTGESPKRINQQTSLTSPNQLVNSFNDYAYYEKDLLNLIKSGEQWFGEVFDIKTDYNFIFNFPNIDMSSPISINFSAAARSSSVSMFSLSIGSSPLNVSIGQVNTTSYHGRYANLGNGVLTANPTSAIINVNVSYNKPNSGAIGWLDELELNARRNLIMSGNQLFYRDVQSVGVGNISTFTLGDAGTVSRVWEITDPFNIREQQYNLNGNILTYSLSTDSLRSFVALSTSYETQIFGLGKVNNQNLHAIVQADMVIVSHPSFLSQATQLADFHSDEGLSVVLVTPEQIYNEFSSGSQDVVAIRDFLRMLYERNALISTDLPKYLLLFGDGSYDNKNRIVGNTNFIPSYQSTESMNIIGSLVSDDYYGLLDINEGVWSGTEYLDIGIGRLPVKSQEEANNVVNKIINYNVPNSMNEWRNRITFIGDDEEGNVHMSQPNQLADIVETNYKSYNINKIFLDAFKQEATAGGSRYPEVNKAINNAIDEGSLLINYTGHGGETGWAHERVLTLADINSWDNTEGFPLFVTATCEFSRWDDPKRTSAGELVLIEPNGGIGLFTTVRLVYSNPNMALNTSFYNEVFEKLNTEMPSMGDVFMIIKNSNASSTNTRNFTLLGDPALKLAYPIHDAITTKINGVSVSSNDTIKALSKVTIEGIVQDENGQKLTNFNGVIHPIVFDKEKQIVSLANDGGNPYTFNSQTSKLFKGKVSVQNGDFSYTFVVPKDIAYNYGKGKLSYYAENQVEDANGYHTDLYIGGTSDNFEADNTGPGIDLFMNDENFVFGGITDENPILLANISDVHGINMVGNGIGHDIVAVLDDKTEDSFILNDYYEADLNSYQNGKVYFPFTDLTEGRHKLTLKVWDVYNNSSEATIEFVVVKSKDITLERVYNYPNPFTTYTEFWFEHNQPSKQLYAQVQIFTVSGKLVKTIEQHILNEGYRATSINWDGLDEYGDRIGRGVYVYRLKVRAENFSVAEKYEKLVILR
jgi:hypothetical protein